MIPPESMTPRYWHSITATSLGPGVTEVLVFGGEQEDDTTVAETTILRFGEQLLVHVAMATTVQQPKRVDFFFWYTFFTFCGISFKVKVI